MEIHSNFRVTNVPRYPLHLHLKLRNEILLRYSVLCFGPDTDKDMDKDKKLHVSLFDGTAFLK